VPLHPEQHLLLGRKHRHNNSNNQISFDDLAVNLGFKKISKKLFSA
jgi:hypothetical protein